MKAHSSSAALTQESIVESIQFRQKLARIARENEAKGSWFFRPWNTPEGEWRYQPHVPDPRSVPGMSAE
jgi:hypothetical protein